MFDDVSEVAARNLVKSEIKPTKRFSMNQQITRSPIIPTCLGKLDSEFAILETLGKGNFGKVFKAKNLINGKICAIKRSKQPIESLKEQKSQVKEIQNWKLLTKSKLGSANTQSHILELYEAWEENGYVYSSSEFCENSDLRAWIKSRNFPLKNSEAWDLVLQTA